MVKHDVVKSHSLLHLGLVNGDSQYIDEYEGVVIISVDSLSLGHLETRLIVLLSGVTIIIPAIVIIQSLDCPRHSIVTIVVVVIVIIII